ncbi:MAG: 4Fe-4S dicluster domain-containing protein [Rikenellaceae bacterium]
MTKINPKFGKDLKRYGAVDFNACYNCGNCTAVCSLATKDDTFPREMVRLSALGAEEEISASLKPWLCYYCGECSTMCPQTAGPGELMMSLRRWLTAKYDWTGLSGYLYKSLTLTIIAMVIVAMGVIWFASYKVFDLVAIMHSGHFFEMYAIAGVLAVILIPNIVRMWYFTIIKPGKNVPFMIYVKSLGEFFVHMFTQKRALGCDNNQKRWFEHFILVIGYLTLLFTTVFLDWFGSDSLFVIISGYVVSAIVFMVTFDFVLSRIKQSKEISKHSQPSDWFFVIWLLLMGITAFAVRLFIDLDIIDNNKWLYLVHLTILAQWALIIVPFGKWTHFLYRSFAMYFAKLTIV